MVEFEHNSEFNERMRRRDPVPHQDQRLKDVEVKLARTRQWAEEQVKCFEESDHDTAYDHNAARNDAALEVLDLLNREEGGDGFST